jgi:hypothetical protein
MAAAPGARAAGVLITQKIFKFDKNRVMQLYTCLPLFAIFTTATIMSSRLRSTKRIENHHACGCKITHITRHHRHVMT